MHLSSTYFHIFLWILCLSTIWASNFWSWAYLPALCLCETELPWGKQVWIGRRRERLLLCSLSLPPLSWTGGKVPEGGGSTSTDPIQKQDGWENWADTLGTFRQGCGYRKIIKTVLNQVCLPCHVIFVVYSTFNPQSLQPPWFQVGFPFFACCLIKPPSIVCRGTEKRLKVTRWL